MPIAIIVWNDEDYYVAGLDTSSNTREALVETCSNHAIYCDNYNLAVDIASNLSQSYQIINMVDYPTPDLGAL